MHRLAQSASANRLKLAEGISLGTSTGAMFFNSLENVGNGFGAEVAFAGDADANIVYFHFALPNHEHGVHLHSLGRI
jgi:hypothetical protein